MIEEEIKALISKKSKKLHQLIGETIDNFILDEQLREDSVALNIVFNALANNMRAIVENNHDIPAESVELMIQSVIRQIRKGLASRTPNQN